MPSVISTKPGKQVEDDDFGFCFSESEGEDIEGPIGAENLMPEAETKINLDNKFVKEDIAILSSLCSDLVSQSGIIKQKKKTPFDPSQDSSLNKFSQNLFLKVPPSHDNENLDFVFRKFSASGVAEIQEKSPERPPAKITGYIKESPLKTVQKKNITRNSDAPTVSSTADKSNPKKRKLAEMSATPVVVDAKNAKLTAFFAKKEESAANTSKKRKVA